MKTAGIVLLILGILSTLGAIKGAAQGYNTSFGSLAFVVLGVFLISRANKKKVEEAEKKDWEKGSSDKEEE